MMLSMIDKHHDSCGFWSSSTEGFGSVDRLEMQWLVDVFVLHSVLCH